MVTTRGLSTDEKVQRDVLDEMYWDPQVKPTDVGMHVMTGVVTARRARRDGSTQ